MLGPIKVSVIIPVYNESINTILMPLESLNAQKKISSKDFEVVIIVSNSKKEAKQKTGRFKKNQEALKFLKTFKSKFVVHIIDRSSAGKAPTFENANSARDFAGRFAASRTEILAFTDADCEFSSNYIYELAETFKNKKIQRVAGKLLFKVEPGEKQTLFELASLVHFGRDRLHKNYRKPSKREPLVSYRPGDKKSLNIAGQNLAVSSKAFLGVGGIGKIRSYDDMLFAKKVDKLGVSVYNPNFWVCTLFRASLRAGLIGLGQRVAHFEKSLDKFLKGQSDKIHIFDWKATKVLTRHALWFAESKSANLQKFKREARKLGADLSEVKNTDLSLLFKLLRLEINGLASATQVKNLEALILKKFYHLLPKKTIG